MCYYIFNLFYSLASILEKNKSIWEKIAVSYVKI